MYFGCLKETSHWELLRVICTGRVLKHFRIHINATSYFFSRVSPSKRMPAVSDPLTTRDLTNQRRDKTISPTKGNFGQPMRKLCKLNSVKPVLNGHLKIDKTKVLKTDFSLMQVKSIAECSLWSILQYIWPAVSNYQSWKTNFLVSSCLRQVLLPCRVAQSVTCLATDACLIAGPGVASSTPARSHTFVEINCEIIFTVILHPSAESFKKGCCQLKVKVYAWSTG